MNGESAFDVFRRLQVKPIAVGVPFWDPIPVGSSNSNSSNDQTSAHDTRKSGPAPASKPPPTTWLYPGEVLEVFGRPGAGKTEFLYQSALSVAMPKRFEGIELGGKVERGVMVIDLDYRFKLRRVQLLLEFRVTSVLAAQGHDQKSAEAYLDTPSFARLQALVMGRIYIARCQTGKDFLTLLTSIQHMIEGTSYTDTSSSDSNSTHIYSHHDEQKQRQSGSGKEVTTSLVVTFEADTLLFSSGHDEHKDPLSSSSASAPAVSSLSSAINDKQRQPAAADVSVLLIDNISTFYWEEYVKGTVFPFYEQVVAALRALMDRCHLPLIVTKQCFIKSQVHMLESQLRHKEALGRKWASLITLRLLLKKEGPNNNNKPNSTNGSSSGGNSNSNSYHIPHLPSNHEPYHCLGHLRLEKSIHSLSSSAVMTDAQCQHRYRSLMNLLTPTKLAQAGSIGTDAGMMSTGDHSRRLQSTGDDSNTIRWWTFRCNFWDTGIQQLD